MNLGISGLDFQICISVPLMQVICWQLILHVKTAL